MLYPWLCCTGSPSSQFAGKKKKMIGKTIKVIGEKKKKVVLSNNESEIVTL